MIAIAALYFVNKHQRNNTAELRDTQHATLVKKIDELEQQRNKDIVEKALMKKDIDWLKEENLSVKQDLKEIKVTLHTMSLAIERIASNYDKDKA